MKLVRLGLVILLPLVLLGLICPVFADDSGAEVTLTVEVVLPPPAGGGGGGIGGKDTKPPRVYDISVSDVSGITADICWTTNEKSTSQVEYWTSPSKFSPLDEAYVTFHSVTLIDLALGTTYTYKAMSEDKAGNLTVSDEYSFTTLGEKPEPVIPEPEEPKPVPPTEPEPIEPEIIEPEIVEPEVVEPEVVEPEGKGAFWVLIGVVGLLVVAGGIGCWLWRKKSKEVDLE